MNDATRKYIEALEEHIEALMGAWDGYDPREHMEMDEQLVTAARKKMKENE